MRRIALDTETTGLSTEQGHRIIEIGCVEMIDRKITGKTFHCYLNPQREVEAGAFAVHGISNSFLKDKLRFFEVMETFLTFIRGAELMIHNAPFDIGFLNYELHLADHSKTITDYCTVLDTLVLARSLHPGKKNSLDAICQRYGVDNSHRNAHGALLDAKLLAEVYLSLTGGQASLFTEVGSQSQPVAQTEVVQLRENNKPLPIQSLTDEEQQAHFNFLELLGQDAQGGNVWEN